MTDTLHRILPQVQKPARYVGGEYNQIVKRQARHGRARGVLFSGHV